MAGPPQMDIGADGEMNVLMKLYRREQLYGRVGVGDRIKRFGWRVPGIAVPVGSLGIAL
jgi:hypothetical protein